jgi:hypothetical protein
MEESGGKRGKRGKTEKSEMVLRVGRCYEWKGGKCRESVEGERR